MKVTMFQDRFAELVKAGTKTQTIRLASQSNPKAGELRSLRRWTGGAYRSKQEVLREVKITAVVRATIWHDQVVLCGEVNAVSLVEREELDNFADRDGFLGWSDLVLWFAQNQSLPFSGVLICWEPSPLET